MRYAISNVFSLEEARALSTSDPMECIPYEWEDRTHLESVGASCLYKGGVERMKGCTSHHAGRKLSTVIYHDAMLALCQVDHPFSGAYVCTEELVPTFIAGYEKLLDEKTDPKSALNVSMDERRAILRQKVDALKDQECEFARKVRASGILEPSNQNILGHMRGKIGFKPADGKDLADFLAGFYYQGLDWRLNHIGMVLYNFGIPTGDLVDPAIEERLESYRKIDILDNVIMTTGMREYFSTDAERKLFGGD